MSFSGRLQQVLVAVVSGLLVTTVIAGCGSSGTTSTVDASPTTQSPTAPDRPPVVVNGGSAAMQAWAADVSAGEVGRLTEKCGMYPVSYLVDRYVDADRTMLNEVLAATPSPGQVGTTWKNGAGEVIDNGSIDAVYACPQVTLAGQEQFPTDLVAHAAKRYLLLEQGRPMGPDVAASGSSETLKCGPTPPRGPFDDPAAADPDALEVGAPQDRTYGDQWPVKAGARVVYVESRLTQLCIRAVTTGGEPYAGPGENCGTHTYEATGTQAGIFVVDGEMTCGDAVAVVNRYFSDPGLDRQGNTMSAAFDGWTCASPTAVAAREAGYSTRCANDAEGITIQLVPQS